MIVKLSCSIKDANRTLFGLEDIDLMDAHTAMDEEEYDERIATFEES